MAKLMACTDLGKRITLDRPRGQRQSSPMRTSLCLGVASAILLATPARPAAAQGALTSDLWRVAAGTLVVPPALASDGSAALWTPAAVLAGAEPRLKLGVEAIHAPAESGVAGTVATVAVRTRSGWTVNAVYGRLSLSDLVRTETSPEAVGGIPAFAQVISLGAARSVAGRALSVGLAVRALTGRLDDWSKTRWAADVGAVWERPRVRLGAATQFLDPRFGADESGASCSLGGEYRSRDIGFWGTPGVVRVRYGATLAHGEGVAHLLSGGFAFSGTFEIDVGAARETVSGYSVWRSRFGAAVTAGPYRVYVGRDGGVNGFGATYRFGLAATVR
jgi:hypothetical protein